MAASGRVPDPGPTWFRLTDEAWAMIGREYLAGATAKAIAARWKVAPSSVYRHAGLNGWTKKRRGEALSLSMLEAERRGLEADRAEWERVKAQKSDRPEPSTDPMEMSGEALRGAARALTEGRTMEAERLVKLAERLRAATGNQPSPVFQPLPQFEDRCMAAGALAAAAASGSGQAMHGGRLREAQMMARLAESYVRLAGARPMGDLEMAARAVLYPEFREALFRVDPNDPEADPVKLAYWEELAAREPSAGEGVTEPGGGGAEAARTHCGGG